MTDTTEKFPPRKWIAPDSLHGAAKIVYASATPEHQGWPEYLSVTEHLSTVGKLLEENVKLRAENSELRKMLAFQPATFETAREGQEA